HPATHPRVAPLAVAVNDGRGATATRSDRRQETWPGTRKRSFTFSHGHRDDGSIMSCRQRHEQQRAVHCRGDPSHGSGRYGSGPRADTGYTCTLTAGGRPALPRAWTYSGPKTRDCPARKMCGEHIVSWAVRVRATDSLSAPRTSVNAPAASPWSCNGARCPGSHVSSQASCARSREINTAYRWLGSYRSRWRHRNGS